MGMRGILNVRDALELSLLLLARGVVQGDLDDPATLWSRRRRGWPRRSTGSGSDLRLFATLPIAVDPLKPPILARATRI